MRGRAKAAMLVVLALPAAATLADCRDEPSPRVVLDVPLASSLPEGRLLGSPSGFRLRAPANLADGIVTLTFVRDDADDRAPVPGGEAAGAPNHGMDW